MENLNKSIELIIKNEFIQTKSFLVDYWESYFNPEDDSKISKRTRVETAKMDYEFSKDMPFEEIQREYKGDYNLCLRAAMRKLYIQARDYNFNTPLKMTNLRKVVLMRQMLNKSDVLYVPYSTKFIMNI